MLLAVLPFVTADGLAHLKTLSALKTTICLTKREYSRVHADLKLLRLIRSWKLRMRPKSQKGPRGQCETTNEASMEALSWKVNATVVRQRQSKLAVRKRNRGLPDESATDNGQGRYT